MFKESLNTACFTTKFVMRDGSDIVFVSHDKDGYWQFHGDESAEDESIAMIVGLGEIIERDPTILEVSSLEEGYYATRESVMVIGRFEKGNETPKQGNSNRYSYYYIDNIELVPIN